MAVLLQLATLAQCASRPYTYESYCELIQVTPLQEEAHAAFDPKKEHHQEHDYRKELQLRAARSLRCGGRQRSALRSDELREL